MWIAFGGRLRGELFAVEAFIRMLEPRVLVEEWRIEYNASPPRTALGYLTPTDDAKTGLPTIPNSHSGWTNNPGPVTLGYNRCSRSCYGTRRLSGSSERQGCKGAAIPP
jgi:hypothetical protein